MNKKLILRELFDDLNSGDPQRLDYAVNNYLKHATDEDLKKLIPLFSHPIWKVREAVFKIFVKLEKDSIFLVKPLLQTENADAKYWAIRVLGVIYPEGFEILREFFKNFTPELKKAVLNSLQVLTKKEVIEFLVETLKDESWQVRKNAYDILSQIQSPFLFPVIEKEFFLGIKENNENFCYWAIKILARKFSAEGIKSLVKAYQKGNDKLRYFIVVALGESSRKEAIPHLINCFADKIWIIRRQASLELLKYGREALPYLVKSFVKKNADIRFWSAWVLSKMLKKKEILREFSKVLQVGDEDLQFFALDVIGDTKDISALKILMPYLSSPVWFLRKQAAENIIKLGDKVIPYIKKNLSDTNEDLVFWSVKILSRLGKAGIYILKEKLFYEDTPLYLKKFIINVLGELEGNVEVDEMLIMALNDKDWPVRNESFQILIQKRKNIEDILVTAVVISSLAETQSEINFWVRKLFNFYGKEAKKILFNLIKREVPESFIFIKRNLSLLEREDLFVLKNFLDSQNSTVRNLVATIFEENIKVLRPFYQYIIQNFSLQGVNTVIELLERVPKEDFENDFLLEVLKEEERFPPSLKEKVLYMIVDEYDGEEKIEKLLGLIGEIYDFRLKDVYFDLILQYKEFILKFSLEEKLQEIGQKFPKEYRLRLQQEFPHLSYGLKEEDDEEVVEWGDREDDVLNELTLEDTEKVKAILEKLPTLPLEKQIQLLKVLNQSINLNKIDVVLMTFLEIKEKLENSVQVHFLSFFLTFNYYKTISYALDILSRDFSPLERIGIIENITFPQDSDYYAKLLRVAFDRRDEESLLELVVRIFSLSSIKSSDIIPVFKNVLLEPDDNFVNFCLHQLEMITAEWVEILCKEILESSEVKAKREVLINMILDLLIKRGKFKYPDVVIPYVQDEDPTLQMKALEVIAISSSEVYYSIILETFSSSVWMVRKKVITLIEELYGKLSSSMKKKSEKILLQAVGDENNIVRSTARDIIINLQNPELLQEVFEQYFIRETNEQLREEIKFLIRQTTPLSFKLLLPHLADISIEVRELVAEIFLFQKEESFRVLIQEANPQEEIVFEEICKILSKDKELAWKLLIEIEKELDKAILEKLREKIK